LIDCWQELRQFLRQKEWIGIVYGSLYGKVTGQLFRKTGPEVVLGACDSLTTKLVNSKLRNQEKLSEHKCEGYLA